MTTPAANWIIFAIGSFMGFGMGSILAWLTYEHLSKIIISQHRRIADLEMDALKPMRDLRNGEPCNFCMDDNGGNCDERRRN